jgi:DNA-binding PadR family transcriptional regulator
MKQSDLKQWAKHTARVPRGFLRYQVLMILKETPLTGSEIATTIERQTHGEYRPGPGSIYPTLKKLYTAGIIDKIALPNGMYRYSLTSHGYSFLEENQEIFDGIRKRLDSIEISSEGQFPQQKRFRQYVMRISKALMQLGHLSSELWTPQMAHEVEHLLSALTSELEEILTSIQQ